MILLLSFITTAVLLLLLTAWILAISARWLKSPRGFGTGLLAVVIPSMLSIGFTALLGKMNQLSSKQDMPAFLFEAISIGPLQL